MRILISILFITYAVSSDIEMKVNSEQRPKEKKIIYGNAEFNGFNNFITKKRAGVRDLMRVC
jgi:hypothetical protein